MNSIFKNLRFRFIHVVSLLIITHSQAQWINVESGSTENLYSISFPTEEIGYICGENGTLIKTIDGGNHWTPFSTGSQNTLRTVSFPASETGYVISSFGELFKTYDGGDSWAKLTTFYPEPVPTFNIVVHFINPDTGFVFYDSANSLVVMRTFDGGIQWDENTQFMGIVPVAASFPTKDCGVIFGKSGMFWTKNMGLHWYESDIAGTDGHFPTPWDGYVASGNYTWVTWDAGSYWYEENSGPAETVFATSFDTAYIAGYQHFAKTFDHGVNWQHMTISPVSSEHWYDMAFTSSRTGFICGTNGQIYKCDLLNNDVEQNSTPNELIKVLSLPSCALSIQINHEYKKLCVDLIDVSGRLILSNQYPNARNIMINRKGIKPGIYLFRLTGDDILLQRGKIYLHY